MAPSQKANGWSRKGEVHSPRFGGTGGVFKPSIGEGREPKQSARPYRRSLPRHTFASFCALPKSYRGVGTFGSNFLRSKFGWQSGNGRRICGTRPQIARTCGSALLLFAPPNPSFPSSDLRLGLSFLVVELGGCALRCPP